MMEGSKAMGIFYSDYVVLGVFVMVIPALLEMPRQIIII